MSSARTEHIARALFEDTHGTAMAWRDLDETDQWLWVERAALAEAAAAEWDAKAKAPAPHPFPREMHWPGISSTSIEEK